MFVAEKQSKSARRRKKKPVPLSVLFERCNAITGAVNGVAYMVLETLTGALSVCGLGSQQNPMRK